MPPTTARQEDQRRQHHDAHRHRRRRSIRGKEPIHVLDKLDLDVPDGSFEALMGPSGSGKSTLLNLIAGLDRPTSGIDQGRRQATSTR